jgi:prolipoprotein diacylglyceryltransferase
MFFTGIIGGVISARLYYVTGSQIMDVSISIGRLGRVAVLYSGCLGFDARHTDVGTAGFPV